MNRCVRFFTYYVFVATVFGYVMFSSLASILGVENRILVVPFRGTVSFFSILLVVAALANIQDFTWKGWTGLFSALIVFGFLCLLIVRALIDTYFYLDNLDRGIISQFWVFFILVTLLPAMGFAMGRGFVSENSLIKLSVYIGLMTVCLAILAYLGTVGFDVSKLYSGRASLKTLNPITLGHAGVSLIVLSYLYATFESIKSRRLIVVFIACVMGLVALVASGSRGPFLSLVACVVFLLAVKGFDWKLTAALVLIVIVAYYMADSLDIYIFERAGKELLEDRSRSAIVSEALSLIKANWFLGAGIFSMATYPHNLIVESYLVVGMVGFFLFILIFLVNIYYAVTLHWSGRSLLMPLLYVQYCSYYMVSGSIYDASMFWLLTFSFLSFNCGRVISLKKEVIV